MSSGRPVCYSWSESGSCKWADQCRFSHGADDSRPAPAPRPFRRGYNSGPSSEACYSFQNTGSCKFGSNCRFSHGDAAGSGSAPASSSSSSSSSASGAAAGSSTRSPKLKSDECFTWRDSGACEYGDKCRYRHGTSDSRDLDQVKKRANGTCFEWRDKGDCKWGTRCRFAHEHLPETETAAAAAAPVQA